MATECALQDITQGSGGRYHTVNCVLHGKIQLNVMPGNVQSVYNTHVEMMDRIANLAPKPPVRLAPAAQTLATLAMLGDVLPASEEPPRA